SASSASAAIASIIAVPSNPCGVAHRPRQRIWPSDATAASRRFVPPRSTASTAFTIYPELRFPGTVRFRYVLVNLFVFCITVLDDSVHQIGLIDRCHLEQYRRNVLIDRVVVKRLRIDRLAARKLYRRIDRLTCERNDRFIDG